MTDHDEHPTRNATLAAAARPALIPMPTRHAIHALLLTSLLAAPLASASLVGPDAPTNLVAAPTAPGTLTLAWNASQSLAGVAGYRVYHVEADGNLTLVADVDAANTTYAETGLTPGVTLTYVVTAFDVLGESEPSAPASATTWSLASAPTNLTATPGPGFVGDATLAWHAPASDGGSALVGYVVYRDGALVATLDASVTTFHDEGLAPFHAYAYQVAALNAVGEGERAGTCGMPSPWTGPLGCQSVV